MFKGPLIVKIIIGLLISYIMYLVAKHYYYKYNVIEYKEFIKNETLFDEDYVSVVDRSEIFDPSVNFSISWKMKIANIPSNFLWNSSYDQGKPIIMNGGCPNIYYKPVDNILTFEFEMLDTQLQPLYKNIYLKDVPVQTWFTIVVVVESRRANIFLNGDLKYSYLLPTVPLKPKGQFKLGSINNNFLGKINNVVYYNYPMDINEAQSIK